MNSSCEICLDSGFEIVDGKGAKVCNCALEKTRLKRLDKIPAKFRDVRLSEIRPQEHFHPKQAAIIKMIQEEPMQSMFFNGRPGVGKTMLMWAVYRHIVEAGTHYVAFKTLADLLEEYRSVFRSFDDGGEIVIPAVRAEALQQNHTKYAIFLDDIDKANFTEYASEQVYRLVNAAYEYGHLLYVSTNKNVGSLIAQFSKRDDARGEPIVRRMLDGAIAIDMW